MLRRFTLAAVLAFGIGGASAHAQVVAETEPLPVAGDRSAAVESEARDLVRECLERMATITRATCERINRISWDGVARLRALAANGAPDGALLESARETLERMRLTADEGRDRINLLSRACLEHLKEIEATPAHARVILEGRERSLGVIGACLREGGQRVRRALAFLTGDTTPTSPIAG